MEVCSSLSSRLSSSSWPRAFRPCVRGPRENRVEGREWEREWGRTSAPLLVEGDDEIDVCGVCKAASFGLADAVEVATLFLAEHGNVEHHLVLLLLLLVCV